MKNILKSAMLFAAAAMAFTSCDKTNIAEDVQTGKKIHLTISTGNPEAENIDGTRTKMEGTTPYWMPGDKIGVNLGDNNQAVFENDKDYADVTTTFSGDINVKNETTTVFTYYPNSIIENPITKDNNTNTYRVKLEIPSTQNPTKTSFDGAADILVGKPASIDLNESQTISGIRFKRLVSVLKIVLADATEGSVLKGQKVISVSATSEQDLVGRIYIHLDATDPYLGDIYTANSTKVEAKYSNETTYEIDGENATYLCVYPQTLKSGSKLTIAGITDDDYEFSKDITIPEDIHLTAGKVTTLKISVNEVTETTHLEGFYAIVAENKGSYYAAGNLGTNSYLSSKDFKNFTGGNESVKVSDNDIIWEIRHKTGSTYTIQYDGKYLYNSATNNTTVSLAEDEKLFDISKNADNTYTIKDTNTNRTLEYNSAAPRFAFYTGTQVNNLYLVPVETLPFINVGEVPTIPAEGITESDAKSFNVTIKNGEFVSAYTREDENSENTADWLHINWSDDLLTYYADANPGAKRTAYIVISANNSAGTTSQTIKISQDKAEGVEQPIEPTTVTFDTSKQGYSNAFDVSQSIIDVDDNIKIDFSKGTNSNNPPKYYANGIRAYGGNTFTISCINASITKIVITYASYTQANQVSANCGTYSDGTTGTWTGSANAVTFTVGGSSGNRPIQTIEITYGGDGTTDPDPETPEPEHKGTAGDPFSVADALLIAQAAGNTATSESYYVAGTISSITEEYGSKYGNATFDIVDKGSNNTTFTIFRVYYFGGEMWQEGNRQIKVGDEVVVYGQLINYNNTTPEMQTGGKLISLNGDTSDGTTDPDPEQPEQPEQPSGGVDVLNNAFTGVSGTSYTFWTNTGASGAVYSGTSAGGNSSIQLNNSKTSYGIVTTTSGGKVIKISVKWNSSTADARILKVYGKNEAYESPEDLYDQNGKQGTEIASFAKSEGNKEIEINGNYTFIGFRSNASALYLDEVKITWE